LCQSSQRIAAGLDSLQRYPVEGQCVIDRSNQRKVEIIFTNVDSG
jgi:hypothetical protein